MIQDETIIADHFFIRFLRVASDGTREVVDRHCAEVVEVVRRRADGSDGEASEVSVHVAPAKVRP